MDAVADAHNTDLVMIDGTSVRVHLSAATLKKTTAGGVWGAQGGGLTTKIHALVNETGLPIRFHLTPGQDHDAPQCRYLLDQLQAGAICSGGQGRMMRTGSET